MATAAGVGKGTVFRRFGDRAGLLQALLQRSEETFQAAHLNGLKPGDGRDQAIEQLHAFGAAAIQRYAKEMELHIAAEVSPTSATGAHRAACITSGSASCSAWPHQQQTQNCSATRCWATSSPPFCGT